MTKTVDTLTDPAFVVYGLDADKKPRAARFDKAIQSWSRKPPS
jgi:hypothetical protein